MTLNAMHPNPVNTVAAINNGLFTSLPVYEAKTAVGEGVGGDVVGLGVGTGGDVGTGDVVLGELVVLAHDPCRYVLYDISTTLEQVDFAQQHNEKPHAISSAVHDAVL